MGVRQITYKYLTYVKLSVKIVHHICTSITWLFLTDIGVRVSIYLSKKGFAKCISDKSITCHGLMTTFKFPGHNKITPLKYSLPGQKL